MKTDERKNMFQKRPFLHFVWATHQLRAVQGNTPLLFGRFLRPITVRQTGSEFSTFYK